MQLTPETLIWAAAASLMATGLGAIAAASLRRFSRHELEEICQRRGDRDRFRDILRAHERVSAGVELWTELSSVITVLAGASWASGKVALNSISGISAIAAVIGLLLMAVRWWLPQTLARLWSTSIVYHTWPLCLAVSSVLKPLRFCGTIVDIVMHRLAGRDRSEPGEETIEEEIRAIVSEGHRGGLLEEDAREMIEGVIELGDAVVSEIMTPRTEMDMVSVHLTWEEMVSWVIDAARTRIPVFDKNRDDVVGILYAKDLLPELAKKPESSRRPIREILRQAHFVPESKAVDDLLQEFQQTRNHLAIVLDEYGGVSGLVTIEDVLEEIVGEIVDEYDDELEDEITQIDASTYDVLGKTHVDEINERLGINLPDDGDFDTIGGFVFTELGRIPAIGETLTWNDALRVTVTAATERRIERLRLVLLKDDVREIA